LNDEDIAEFSFISANEPKQMFQWFKEYGFFGKDKEINDISISKKLYPNIKTLEPYLTEIYGKK